TRYNGSPRADSNHPLYSSVDIENGFLFATYMGGLQIWDARGSNATQPVRLSQADGWSGQFPAWISGNAEIDQYVYAVDAPEGNDNLIAVGALTPVGLSIWDTTDKTGPKGLYQDTKVSVQQVYSATIGGRAYAFAGSWQGDVGVHVYDMTAAKAHSRCVDNCSGVHIAKAGSTATTYVHGMQFGNKHFIARSAGSAKPWITEIWNVTNPSSPSLVVSGQSGVFAAGVAMWEQSGNAYMGLRVSSRAGDRLQIYNVTSCLNSGCASLPTPVYDKAVPNSATDSPHWMSLDFSRSGSTPFLFLGHHDLCHTNVAQPKQLEMLLNVSNPAVPTDVTPTQTILSPANAPSKTLGYWTWYYSTELGGYSFAAPRGGKFNGEYFYRAGVSLLDIHRWTGGGGSPPVANFTWSPSEIYAGDTVTFTDASTGAPTSRSWTFQDGSPATGSAASQAVTFASPGTKSASLVVSKDTFSPSTKTQSVTVLNPAPAIGSVTTDAAEYFVCQPVTFTATATGRPALSYSWRILNPDNPTGVVGSGSTYKWDSKVNLVSVPGQYRGEVTVQNASGSAMTTSALITLKALGTIPVTFAPTNDPFQAGTVQFHAAVPGATEWSWDFGDGAGFGAFSDNPVTGPNPVHSYTSIGSRNVRVRVRNCQLAPGVFVESSALTVNITQIAPLKINQFQAQCNVAPCLFGVNEAITFAQVVEGDPNTYKYDWDGNGSYEQTSTTPILTHTYTQAGSYKPKMAIVRGTEQEVTKEHSQFTVSGNTPPPPPPPTPAITIGGASSGQVNTAVTLTASASNCTASANGWTWTTGGGNGSSTTSSISITWTSSGPKTVTARNSGCPSATGTKSVTIGDTPGPGPGPGGLISSFTFSPATPAPGAPVTFDASA
ncbi:MAG TPA: PKD domain-containing protein, partial [Thermoanaerobaculia bacterium]|nr:PKD domain-containing protein [Thermoanaerobaculia bacterium]